jgi:hypothetical protein
MRHPAVWHTARPLWDLALEDGAAGTRFHEPVLLRLRGDKFMDDLLKQLGADPAGLAEHVARPESWDAERAGWLPADELAEELEESGPPHLFQPAHGRFYVVAASLVCRLAGLPDRAVDPAADKVSFVVRRLGSRTAGTPVDPADSRTWREHAWIGDRSEGVWMPLDNPAVPLPGEERLPLFSLAFTSEGKKHRLHAGLIPAGGREVYEGGMSLIAAPSELEDDPLGDPRMAELRERILPGLAGLAAAPDDASDAQAREALLFVLLDLAAFLARELPGLWDKVEEGTVNGAPGTLEDALEPRFVPGGPRWHELLLNAEEHRREILAGDLSDDLLPVQWAFTRPQIETAAAAFQAGLDAKVAAALPELPPLPPPPAPVPVPAGAEEVRTYYVIRCVFERSACAPFHDPVVSRASRPFSLAAFFDPEAPARPLRIRMPVDTSLKGLSRFPKGVSILLSNKLRQQMAQAQAAGLKGLTDGDPGPEGPAFDLGMICSFSIPIITICALILLMIIVQLLNIVFWWLPLFRICLPLPIKAPSGGGGS